MAGAVLHSLVNMKALVVALLLVLACSAQAKNATLYLLNDAIKTVSKLYIIIVLWLAIK